ncbi:hypothetical protein [Kitasatospora sp. NPDC057198]|uniref:hypothetical protein n=1 Tax=Kitasatospora sp. NPDC057198 TaxID=3346046 RepID=UPI00363F2AD8
MGVPGDLVGVRRGRSGALALAGAVLLLGTACTSGGGSPGSAASAGNAAAAGPAATLCRAVITAADLPAGYTEPASPRACEGDPETWTVSFPGQAGSIEMATELLSRKAGPDEASADLPELVAELNATVGRPEEQDAAPFRDLGDEVRRFARHDGPVFTDVLYLRRGRLLVYLSVMGHRELPQEELHRLAAKAVERTAPLG